MNTVKCSNCGNENISTNIRCEKCGKQLISDEEINNMNLIQQDPIKNSKIESGLTIFGGVRTIFVGAVFSGISSLLVFKSSDSITRIVGIPFLICGVAVLIYGILLIIKGINTNKNTNDYVDGKLDMNKVEKSEKDLEKAGTIVNSIYIFGFLLFWFGFLIVFDISSIKTWEDGGNQMFFFSIIFWLVGIYILINKVKKDN